MSKRVGETLYLLKSDTVFHFCTEEIILHLYVGVNTCSCTFIYILYIQINT